MTELTQPQLESQPLPETPATTEQKNPEGYTALKVDVQSIPLEEIFSDSEFNCRGNLKPSDFLELSKSIAAHGLLQPITVQPWSDLKKPILKYRIVMGHCRYAACKHLKWPTIPAIVREFTSDEAFYSNVIENINRVQLNIQQEARIVRLLRERGLTAKEIQTKLKQSSQWVQVRLGFNDLPKKIQDDVLQHSFNQKALLELISLPSEPRQYKFLRQLKEKKERFEAGVQEDFDALTEDFRKAMRAKKPKTTTQISAMRNRIYDMFGPNLATRFGAWAVGAISSDEFEEDLKQHALEEGCDYSRPQDLRDLALRDDI